MQRHFNGKRIFFSTNDTRAILTAYHMQNWIKVAQQLIRAKITKLLEETIVH